MTAQAASTVPLKEADKVEILTVVDNTIDILMAGTPQARLPAGAVCRHDQSRVKLLERCR